MTKEKEINSFEELVEQLKPLCGGFLRINVHSYEKYNNVLKSIGVKGKFQVAYEYPIKPHKREKHRDYLYSLAINTNIIIDESPRNFHLSNKNPQKIYNVIKSIMECQDER